MFAVNTYEEIEKNERQLNDRHIIVLLFVRPSLRGAQEIINEFDYLKYNAGRYCSVYAVGYTNDAQVAKEAGFRAISENLEGDWYFSEKAFSDFKNALETRLGWRYSSEVEIVVLQSNPDGAKILNFQNYVALDVNYGIQRGYIASFPRLMEALLYSARSEVTAAEAVTNASFSRFSIRNILLTAIEGCKKIPSPIKSILGDRLFYWPSFYKAPEPSLE